MIPKKERCILILKQMKNPSLNYGEGHKELYKQPPVRRGFVTENKRQQRESILQEEESVLCPLDGVA